MKAPLLASRTSGILGTFYQRTSEEFSHGMTWYSQAHTVALNISQKYPVEVSTAAGVIAALSPNNKWDRNIKDALSLIQQFTEAGPDEASQVKVCTYSANKQKALAILSIQGAATGLVAAVLNGRKVSAFFRCILGDQQSVCVDGHAYSIWVGETIPTTKVPGMSKPLYERIAHDYQEAAAIVSRLECQPITPAQLQAVTWVTHRRLRGL